MKYKVKVTRTGYSVSTFDVEANSPEEAEDKALNKAYNTVFSEYNSDYEPEIMNI